jgi:hypothetical protein
VPPGVCCSTASTDSLALLPPSRPPAPAADSVQKGAKKLGSRLSLKRGGSKDTVAGGDDALPSPAQ